MFLDMANLVEEQVRNIGGGSHPFTLILHLSSPPPSLSLSPCNQGELIDVIEHNVEHAADFVRKGQQETRQAVRYQRTGRKVGVSLFFDFV